MARQGSTPFHRRTPMDAGDFEFPPDQVEEDLRGQPAYSVVPLSALVNTPIEELPPTQPPGGVTRSLRQTIRGVSSLLHQSRQSRGSTAEAHTGRPSSGSSSRGGTEASRLTSQHDSTQTLVYLFGGNGNGVNAHDEFALEPLSGTGGGAGTQASAGEGTAPQLRSPLAPAAGVATAPSGRLGGVRRSRTEWSEAEVRRFYGALSQYGTDFAAIAVLFPEHTREEVKRLYHRELRRHQNQVRQALNDKQTIDLDTFSTLLQEKEKKEKKPTKELNTEEEDMLSRIALGAASPSNTNAPEGESAVDTVAGKRKAPKRPRNDSVTAVEPTTLPRSEQKGKVKKEKKRGSNDSDDAGAEVARHGAEETLLETAMRLQRESNRSFAEAAFDGCYGEFDFDEFDV